MAYETGVPTSQQDFLDKLRTFATANGWTQDEWDTTAKRLSIHRNNVYVQFRWDNTDAIGIYQSLGYTGGNNAGNHPNDSGNGLVGSGNITTDRRINRIGVGPYTAYHFFEGDVYLHAVLEVSPGLYRHVSFGEIIKNGTWTGGEYCAGTVWAAATTGGDSNQHCVLVDHAAGVLQDCATIHLEQVAGDPAASKWGVLTELTSVGNDRGANARLACIGGWRDGFFQHAMGWIQANPNNGYVPMFPLHVYRRKILTPQQWHLLGTLPDIRFINIGQIVPGDEFVVGSDTWKCFPWIRKRFTPGTPYLDESGNMGMAIKKIV